jgi:hypothetical protein
MTDDVATMVSPKLVSPGVSMRSRSAIGVFLLVCTAVGCREPGSARYEGSVENTSREQRGAGRLTVFSRTDSTFGGYLDVEKTLGGGGLTFGWSTPTGWHLRTTSGAGDTVLWRGDGRAASLSGAALTGSFTIIGGPKSDEIGTFEWRLVRGRGLELPEQRPEFVSTAAMSLEGTMVVVATLGGALLLIVAVRWVRAAPFARQAARRPTPLNRDLDGVGGWMAWFLIGQGLTSLVMLVGVKGLWSPFVNGTWVVAGTAAGVRSVLVLEAIVHGLQVVIPAIGLVLTLRNSRQAPRLWFVYLSALALYAAVDITATSAIESMMREIAAGDELATLTQSLGAAVFANVRLLVFCLIWLAYWSSSQRVLVTFGGQALTDWRHGLVWPWQTAPAGANATSEMAPTDVNLNPHLSRS